MITNNKTFSQNYETLVEVCSCMKSKTSMVELLNNWAHSIVDLLTAKDNDKYTYEVMISLKPNPKNYKGIDSVYISVVKTEKGSKKDWPAASKEVISTDKTTMGAAIAEINKYMDDLTKISVPEVVEINGKKYRLVEEK